MGPISIKKIRCWKEILARIGAVTQNETTWILLNQRGEEGKSSQCLRREEKVGGGRMGRPSFFDLRAFEVKSNFYGRVKSVNSSRNRRFLYSKRKKRQGRGDKGRT